MKMNEEEIAVNSLAELLERQKSPVDDGTDLDYLKSLTDEEIEADVLEWYKTKGDKFQSSMVSILKKYMQAHL